MSIQENFTRELGAEIPYCEINEVFGSGSQVLDKLGYTVLHGGLSGRRGVSHVVDANGDELVARMSPDQDMVHSDGYVEYASKLDDSTRDEIFYLSHLSAHHYAIPEVRSIVSFYLDYDDESRILYTTPFVEGDVLNESSLSISERLKALVDALDAISSSHGQGIVHRDLKPGNIVAGSNHAILLDWEFADSSPLPLFKYSGTEGFLAPEISLNRSNLFGYDERVDIASAGYTLKKILDDAGGSIPGAVKRSFRDIFERAVWFDIGQFCETHATLERLDENILGYMIARANAAALESGKLFFTGKEVFDDPKAYLGSGFRNKVPRKHMKSLDIMKRQNEALEVMLVGRYQRIGDVADDIHEVSNDLI